MRFFTLITVFLWVLQLPAQPHLQYLTVKQDHQSVTLTFNFPEPVITRSEQYPDRATVEMPGLIYNYEEEKPLVPVYSTSVVVPEGRVSWKILKSEVRNFPGIQPIIYHSRTEAMNSPATSLSTGIYPEQTVRVIESGIFRDYRIMGVTVFPVQVSDGGITVYQSLQVRIQLPQNFAPASVLVPAEESRVFENFAANAKFISAISPVQGVNPPSVPVQQAAISYDSRVKIIVDRRGIYTVTGQDLSTAGVAIQDINPQSFRLTNRGNDVALYISGDQDLVFDATDVIEFLGERNEKTFLADYPDLYSDPFSDENVYWLSWGGSPGIRMVEESGAIVNTNPSQYNRALFYPFTVHLERDSHFERFGYGSTGKLSYTRDLWFYDSGIQAISKRSYPVTLLHPDSSSFNPVSIKMAFAGRSQTRHTLMAWLNQRLVGQSSSDWLGQNTHILSNASSSAIRTIDLTHGTNNLEIQLTTPSAGTETDWVLFNWADITYDRKYKAESNYIEFRKPSPSIFYDPNIKLFQFEITNFTRPDIEIYKKGISKIVNYRLEVQGSGSSLRYRIIFQDNIYSDDVEYIALSSNSKLTPKRIEKDEPYDPQNPLLTLKDASNSADYLIITHNRFYERLQELLEFRRNQGLDPVMVDVQDIYDEFNYGIKSPLAIKDFLQYAFYNWDRRHRLKYVVLVGNAIYNYKSTSSVNQDFVPTFFYQSREFGAIATDLPYALVAGEDYLPDLFIGRIPVTTNGEVTNIIKKIRDIELNPVIGPWRNQSLFISGNDRSTPEFPQIPYLPKKPAFRTQNQRVIDMLLDKRFSSFKLNTIRDTSLTFDPNFGGTTDLIDYFDNGLRFVNFLGHGGGGIWADVSLMNLQDVDRLNNTGKYPFVTSMTCFTGAFENPGKQGLAQRLLLAPDRGAIGILASSGLGWLSNDYSMLWNVMKNFDQPAISMGEVITLGKIDYYINSQYVLSDTLLTGQFMGSWGSQSGYDSPVQPAGGPLCFFREAFIRYPVVGKQ